MPPSGGEQISQNVKSWSSMSLPDSSGPVPSGSLLKERLQQGPGGRSHISLETIESPEPEASTDDDDEAPESNAEEINVVDWNNEIVDLQWALKQHMKKMEKPMANYKQLLDKTRKKWRQSAISAKRITPKIDELQKVKENAQKLYNAAWNSRQDAYRRLSWDGKYIIIRCHNQSPMQLTPSEFCDCEACRCSQRSIKVLRHQIIESEEKLSDYRKLLQAGDKMCWRPRSKLESNNQEASRSENRGRTMKFRGEGDGNARTKSK